MTPPPAAGAAPDPSARLQGAVLQIAEAAAAASSLPELLRAVHGIVGGLMPARNFYVALHDASSDLISFPYFVDEKDAPPSPRRPRRGMTEYVLRTGQPLLAVPELYPELERRGDIEIIGTDSVDWLGVPLKLGEETIGVIAAQTYTEGVRYTERELLILQFVATQVAGAIERRRVADARLRADEELRLLAQAVKSTRDYISLIDLEGRITFANRAFLEGYGFAEHEVLGQTIALIDSARNPPGLRHEIEAATERGGWSGELWNRRKDGSEFFISLSTSKVVDAEGRVIGLMGVCEDITALHASERKYREVVESAPVGIYQSTPDGRLLTANPALARILGFATVEELMAVRMTDFYADPDERAVLLERYLPLNRASDLELTWKRQDGTPVRIMLDAHAVLDASGDILYLEGFVRDITARTRLEDQLRQAQKMEAIGRLAGGVAHDFNNLLTAILGYSSALLDEARLPPDQRHHLEQIQAAAVRAETLTQQLLAFSRRQVLQPVELLMNDVVGGVERLLRRVLGEHVELVTRLAPDAGAVLADRGQIEQVIINLAVNARDAMPQGGTLTMETSNVALDAGSAQVPDATPGPYVVLSVSDTGVGISPTVRARIFEPFFTTKGQGEGTGLGLATVYGILQQSGGHITVYSEPGRGSTFRVYLPRVEPVRAPAAAAPPLAPPTRGSETVLLVEDEPAVRDLARLALERFGYHVLEAGNGPDALRLAEGYDRTIHLLLTDVVMPGMSGRELSDQLTLARPDVRTLFTSGYSDGVIVHHGMLSPGVAYLQKPYRLAELGARVREVLDAPGAATGARPDGSGKAP